MTTMLERRDEVRAWAVRKGWRGEGAAHRTVGEECALLHSELSEALEAYRVMGTTPWVDSVVESVGRIPTGDQEYNDRKPEGVPSEIADTLIRLLDNYAERGVEPFEEGSDGEKDARANAIESLTDAVYEKMDRMPPMDLVTILHGAVSEIYKYTNEFVYDPDFETYYDVLLWLLIRCSTCLGIDLFAEYEAKMKYNETREHRHGGKQL